MSWVTDLLAAVRRVVLLEDRVDRLDKGVEALTAKVADTRDRVIRLEGLIEGAVRARQAPPPTLPPPS